MATKTLRFPYVCAGEEICTRDKFMTWDVDQGWSWDIDTPVPLLAKRLQSWLLFGLVSVYLEEDIPHSRLLTQDTDGREIVDIVGPQSRLRGLLNTAGSSLKEDPYTDDVLPHKLPVLKAILHGVGLMRHKVITLLNKIDDGSVMDMWTSEWYAIIFGVDTVLDILYEPGTKSKPQANEWYRSQFEAKNSNKPSLASEVRVVRDTVNQTGRCPSLAGRLRPSSKAWLDILLLPPTGVSQNHSRCRILHCQLNDVKKDEYQVRHAESCSGCELQSADQPALVTAINGDRIPLVSCFLDSNAILRFKIVEGDLNFKYTAISHVWTGGLGNYERNALPSCQLAYLWSIVKGIPDMQATNVRYSHWGAETPIEEMLWKLSELLPSNPIRSRGSVYFWIDTLCIPIDRRFSEHRQKAIASMGQIYAAAETVLVLDTHMQQLRNVDSGHATFMTHLSVSPWMARSWTLQEAAVAPSLCVRLKERTAVLKRLQHQNLLSISLHQTNCLFKETLQMNPTYNAVWNTLARRATTQRDDLDGIFATLLNLKAAEILALPKHLRMKAIISTQPCVPFSLMCISREDLALEISEGSWVPAFPDTSLAMFQLDNIHGTLRIEQDGFVFEKVRLSRTFGILVQGSFADSDVFTIEDTQESEHYAISTPTHGLGLSRLGSSHDILFFFTYAPVINDLEYQGCSFEVLSLEDSTMTLKYHSSFRWCDVRGTSPEDQILKGARFKKLGDPSFRVLIAQGKPMSVPRQFSYSISEC